MRLAQHAESLQPFESERIETLPNGAIAAQGRLIHISLRIVNPGADEHLAPSSSPGMRTGADRGFDNG